MARRAPTACAGPRSPTSGHSARRGAADIARWILTLASLVALTACGGERAPDHDIIFRGGLVVDGTGAAPRVADVAISGGIIREIGDLRGSTGRREIDARGRIVAPGFIDMHSHADLILLDTPERQLLRLGAKIRQGVTTIVVGNCGLGVAPSNDRASEILGAVNAWMTPRGVTAEPMSIAGYLDRLEDRGVAVNVATLAPHGPIRIGAMGLAPGEPTETQLEAMRAEVERALDDGAFGLSTGLIYPPGMYSTTDELLEFAGEVARRDALYTSHIRGSSETLLPATRELIRVAAATGARVHHSHLEAVGRPFWDDVREVLALEDAARASGLRVSHDVFPYTRAATMMSAIFPPWSLEGGVPGLLGRLADEEQRARIGRDIASRTPEWPPWQPGGWPHNLVGAVGWDGILVASVGPEGPGEIVGRDLETLSSREGVEPFDFVADLMLSEKGRVGQQVAEISGHEEDLDVLLEILRHPHAAIVSDAEDYGLGTPHPAHAGAFARAFRLNRERDLMPTEELIRRMTGYPAELIGLEGRGVLRTGNAADLVLLDVSAIEDRATWTEPRLPATGIRTVVLGGHVIVEDGVPGDGLHGTVLRRRPGN